ncbi:DUF4386 domain-containing protein [Granulicella arctica]|uniref:DUF4386 domain-containing protein n=1 Tax=Granulicella arctica TaxID=940613 RepID=UPI0021E0BA15|nr:DUF4386 domain-containing protein [Granulicella arctica]
MPSCNDENGTSGLSPRQAALVAGITYLLNPVTFAEAYVMPRLISADPVETLRNLTAHPHLFSAAVLSYVVSAVGDVVMAWALYVLLRPIDRALAMLGSVLQLVYAAAWLSALSNLGLIYRLVAVPAYARHTSTGGLPTQIAELLGAYHSGWGLSLVLFGLHLVVTGWLIAQSFYLPRWIGWLLFLAGWAWVVDSVALYFVPEPHLSFLKVIFAAELIFMVWLLGWGWRITEPSIVAKERQ